MWEKGLTRQGQRQRCFGMTFRFYGSSLGGGGGGGVLLLNVLIGNCHRSEETKKTWQLNGVWDPRPCPEVEKGYQWGKLEKLNTVYRLTNSILLMLVSWFWYLH